MCKRLLVPISFVLLLGLVGNALGQPTGELLFEHWMDIGGTAVADLTGDPRYPDNPDDSELRPSFEAAVDWADNYGTRARGYLYPPEDGDYTLWISGDDFIELYLSTDADPANAVMIAEVPGWTNHLEWNKYPEQQSAPITLVGGQTYYIEGIVKEAGGGDSMTAGWTGPGIGTELTIIDGAFLSPADWAPGALKAKAVVPEDGAVDVDVTALEWAAGKTAVSHTVYLSTDETIDDADLLGTTDLTIQIAVLDDGTSYYWRVDETDADGNVIEGDVWSFATIPLEAHFPVPEDGARSQALNAQLSWTPGKVVIMHDVYFGTDEAAIAARDMTTFKGKLMEAEFDPGALDVETTYYWAVDQFTPPPTGTVAGPVWSFTTIGSVPITDPDLLLYYDFELGEGTTALDQSGHSNHGQFNGSPQWVDGAVSIDIATLDYIETAAPLGIVSNTVSVTGWVKHDESPAAWSGILTHRGTSPGNVGLQHNGVELRYMWGADVYWDFSSGLEMPNGEWYFAAVTISPDQGKLYLNGIEQTATNVAPHEPTNFDSLIRVGRDHNDDRIMTSLIDEVRFYNRTLTDVEILALAKPNLADVTAPGDVVQGVPNDGLMDGDNFGWPGAETPDLAIDDDTGTKFLHFKGELEPTGFQVEPAMGPTIVTGMTLTTANDAEPRDPASYEISGSNVSIDGPYELIAAGDLVDFAQADVWPRFTMNATAISFDNAVAYRYYQVMFPTVRDAGSANSMQIAEVELLGVGAPDVTAPGDTVRGVPNDGDWPGAESPDLAIDDDSGTKYLHRKGGAMATGFQVEPSMGKTIVNGLTLTTANDDYGRDPISFELSGSNESIDGPYELIAAGDVVDFAQEELWPRFTRNATAISFENAAGYKYYQVVFPTLRDPATPLMQIAEVELLGVPAPKSIIWVDGDYDDNGDGAVDDLEWVDILEAEGYSVDNSESYVDLDDAKIAALNAADLIIVSRNSNSGDYDDGDEIAQWNAITTPIINSSTHIVRNTRWKFVDSEAILSLTPTMVLADGTEIPGINADVGPASFIDAAAGNGTVLATGDGLPFIIEWEAGVEYYDGAGEIAGGPRMFFAAGTQEDTAAVPPIGRGEMNLTDEGLAIFLDAVSNMISAADEPVNILANGGLEDDLTGAGWGTYGDASMEVVSELVDAAVPDVPIEGSNCLHVTVGSAGANFWDAGLQHGGHVFEAGKSYTLSVWFKSKSGPFNINIKPERAADPWDGFGSQEITITEEWDVYAVNTGVIAETVDPASITFHIAYAPGEFWVDDAVFTED